MLLMLLPFRRYRYFLATTAAAGDDDALVVEIRTVYYHHSSSSSGWIPHTTIPRSVLTICVAVAAAAAVWCCG